MNFLKLSLILLIPTFCFAKRSFDGGMSGGGGHVINPQSPDEPVSPECVEDLIEKNVLPSLRKYLIEKKQSLQDGAIPGAQINQFEKLFFGEADIFHTIHHTKLVIQEDQSCTGSQGEPTDGSFYKAKRSIVCISAKNISDKVHRNEIQAQSQALLIHEYAELMGHSDEEATNIQKTVLEDLKQINQ